MIVTMIPTDLVTHVLLSSFCPFLQTKKRIRFSASWWSGNEKYFCVLFFALYFKAMRNSTDFYKGIFLHIIPVCIIVRIIVSCFKQKNSLITHQGLLHNKENSFVAEITFKDRNARGISFHQA